MIDTTDLKKRIAEYYRYISKKLNLKSTPNIRLVDSPKNAAKEFALTGYFHPESKTITVYITGRHPVDILRTISHELIHFHQHENKKLGNTNSTVKGYAQSDDQLRNCEIEAYALGNIIFRDFEDEKRYGKPKNVPFLPGVN